MRSRHVGRAVLIGTVTPNRNGRVPPVVLESVIACPFVARIGARLVVQRGAVDEFLGAAVERSAFDDVDELVGCPLSERAKSTGRVQGLTGREQGLGHSCLLLSALYSRFWTSGRANRRPVPGPIAKRAYPFGEWICRSASWGGGASP